MQPFLDLRRLDFRTSGPQLVTSFGYHAFVWIILVSGAFSGIFRCLVMASINDALLKLIMTEWVLQTLDAPRITLAPRDHKVMEGGTVSFFCKSSGNPAPDIHWLKNGKRVTSNRNRFLTFDMPHGSVLRIEPVKAQRDDTTISCVAQNSIGEPARASASLQVYPQDQAPPSGYPRITENPTLKAVEKDRNTVMLCAATGNPDPTITWLKDFIPVDMSDPRLTLLSSGSLQIEKSQESDEGRYECVAENNAGVSYSYVANLYVRDKPVIFKPIIRYLRLKREKDVRRVPPHFSIPPESSEVLPGGSVNLTCVAVGSPMPYVKWRKGAQELTPEENIPIGKNVLMLTNVRESANYTCVASSDLGNIEAVAQVKVKALPKPPINLVTSEVTPTSVKLTWSSGNTDPVESFIIEYKRKYKEGATYTQVSNIQDMEYVIRQLQAYTVYELRVVAVNNIGRGIESSPTEVTTGEMPPGSPPQNVRARPLSSSTVLVQWNEPDIPNGVIRGYKVFYTLQPNLPISTWTVITVDNNNLRLATLSNLQINKTYTICVLAFTGVGDGPLSEPIQVKTQQGDKTRSSTPGKKGGVPTQSKNLQGVAISPNSIQLSWERPEDSGESIISYELYYNDSHFRQNVRITITPPVENFLLEDLTPDTLYNIRVAAKSDRGEGASTPIVQVKTEPYFPSAPPQDVHASALDSTSIQVTWKPPPEKDQNGVITSYTILYSEAKSGGGVNDAMRAVTEASDRTYIIRYGLRRWTMYKIWMLASTRVGDGPTSDPIMIRTDESADVVHLAIATGLPGEPRKVKLKVENSTAVKVSWRPPHSEEQNGIIRGYLIHYVAINENDEPTSNPNIFNVVGGDKAEMTIINLEPDTWYQFQVNGYTRKGDGQRSRGRKVKTKGAVSGPPQSLRLVLVAEDPPVIRATWERPLMTHGVVDGFRLRYGKKGDEHLTEKLLVGNTFSYSTSFLDRGVTYEFRVAAKNTVDYGEDAVATLKTPDGIPGGPPKNISIFGISINAIRLQWDLPAKNMRNGDVVMYQVSYFKGSDPITTFDLNTTEAYMIIDNLEKNTDYVFQVKAFTSIGAGPWSDKMHFRTYGELPPAPKNVRIKRLNPTALEVAWDSPDFPVAGYRIFYNKYAVPNMAEWHHMDIGPFTVVEITGLEEHSVYAVRVQARAVDNRYGNLSDPAISNDIPKAKQDQVANFRDQDKRATTIVLVWNKPKRITGVLFYRLDYRGELSYRDRFGNIQKQVDNLKTRDIAKDQTHFVVEKLQPSMTYTFNMTTYYGNDVKSDPYTIHVQTLPDAPPSIEQPKVKSVQQDAGTITLALPKASGKHGPIGYYFIVVVPDKLAENMHPDQVPIDESLLRRFARDTVDKIYIAARFERDLPSFFVLGDGQTYGGYENKPLPPDGLYRVFVRAYTDSLYTSSHFSDSLGLSKAPSTDGVQNQKPKSNLMIIILAPICIGIVVIVLIILVTLFFCKNKKISWRALPTIGRPNYTLTCWRRRKVRRKEPGRGQAEPTKLFVDPPAHPTDPVEMRRLNHQTPAMMNHPPIPFLELQEHVERLKANDNLKFSQEYESIEPGQQFTWDNSNLEVNKPKNRYANVIAYDHSRVLLQPIEGIPGSDYINANYMDGYRKQNAYIATQGPLPETFGDFWRMIWEQRTATVVMMTKLEERTRIKCDQYWPNRGTDTFGFIHVTIMDVMELATYTIRTFQIQRHGFPEKREVRQFQFTAWPDHGVPDHPTPLLMFMRRVKTVNPPDAGPLITHCSAGVGRTGAFIVIDSMLERIKHEKTVDIYGHVTCLRAQRNYMVQTEDQYIFIHDALIEAIQGGNTEVPARNLFAHIQKLTQPDQGETVTGMEVEFKKLASIKANPSRFVSASLAVNKFKNRLVNILPYESTRVCLQPIRGVDGSDYINASFIDGYRYRTAYIATQGPLAETTEDFWRMLWEHNSTIVVMLTKLREMGREKCHQYWPSERSARYQYFVVDPMAEYNMPQYILREFKVTDARDGQSRTVRQFQFTDWPEQGVPKSGEGFIDFIGQVHKTKEQFGQDGPITVHCSAGVGRTGVFISLSIVLERMRYEGVVDMFQTVKMLRTQRPAMVQTEAEYGFCYVSTLEYLGSFDHYYTS
ncbi:tyrosine-protein phosphatase Lar-like isoform X3 [Lineus longissimus]|uniref:tyrosine-protein phosphatase Lar-like isoform X3 n=1 Tax=Lineus longissimus TaxID=88925 RepID=UPI00315DB247